MSERTVVITGASDGIGAAAARALTRTGDRVVVVGRFAEKTRAVAAELGADAFLADFARLDDVRALADRLIESSARVITTSSVANKAFGHLEIDDLEARGKYSPNKAYGDSKLANVLFTKELHERYAARGITAASFHPGGVATNFAADSTSPMRFVYGTVLKRVLISPEKGADTLVWLATAQPGADWVSGEYHVKRKVAKANAQAYDASLARTLWDRSAAMVG